MGNAFTKPYGTPMGRSPAFQKEWTYTTPFLFSGNAVNITGFFSATIPATYGENGASAVVLESPGTKYSFIIWGWQGVYIAGSGNNKGHAVVKIANNANSSHGLVHFSDDDNTVVNLSQPTRFQPGEDIIFKVLDSDMKTTDTGIIELYYSVINGYED
jgi:hypothetical protein